jgi:hypothetical protein
LTKNNKNLHLNIKSGMLRNKIKNCLLIFLLNSTNLFAQNLNLNIKDLEANKTFISFVKMERKEVLKVLIDTTIATFDEPTFVKIKDMDFKNGTIEVKVLSRLVKNAPASARGFIGLAFRIENDNSKFENIYIRPTNGRADDQIRRNHSIQYFSYPNYKFDRLRKDAPEKYESYADMGLNEWITMRIEVNGSKAQLYLQNNKQPSLIVNDLKHGDSQSGAIGLWVGNWTEGYFKDLRVIKK